MFFGIELKKLNINNIMFSESIKNNIIDNNYFYKFNYSDNFIVFNNLYIVLDFQNYKIINDKIIFNENDNFYIIQELIKIENYLLDFIKTNKKKIFKLREILENNSIKFYYNNNIFDNNYILKLDKDLYQKKKSIILKISGCWESDDNIGLTFKFILFNNIYKFYPSVE
tara:strand:+ start:263 stop:769 length:507 start_codon:yes stop_codon:yes gene_type:complete